MSNPGLLCQDGFPSRLQFESKYGPKLFGIPLPQWGWEDVALRGNFAAVHRLAALVFAVLIAIHVAAALKHLLVDKDSVFQRMLPR